MNNNTTISLISKLIEKTKSSSIRWEKYSSSSIALKPLPTTPLDTLQFPIDDGYIYSLDADNSFICTYNEGVFALLLYTSALLGSYVHLRIQTQKSQNSNIFASSNSQEEKDINEVSQLKRLYNLVNTTYSSFDIDTFVDDFLKSE